MFLKNGTHLLYTTHHVSNIRNVRLDRHYFIRSLSRIPLFPLRSYIFRLISRLRTPRVSSSKCQLERLDNSIRGNNQQAFPFSWILYLYGGITNRTAQKWIDRRVWNEVAEVDVRIKRQHSNFSFLSSELGEGEKFRTKLRINLANFSLTIYHSKQHRVNYLY